MKNEILPKGAGPISLIIDGHVEADRPTSPAIIGNGDEERPEGIWTVAAGD